MKVTKYIFRGLVNIKELLVRRGFKLAQKSMFNYFFALLKIPFFVPKPAELQLEPFLGCNLRCKMCNIKKVVQQTSPVGVSEKNFDSLLKQIIPIKTINFTGMGESLLNKNLGKFIMQSHANNIETLFITNGQLLDKKAVDDVLETRVKKICISMESADPKTYESIRCGGSFCKLEKNMKYLMRRIRESNSEVIVSINVVLLKENLEQIKNIYQILDFAKKLKIAKVTFQNPHDVREAKKNSLPPRFQLIEKYARQKGIEIILPPLQLKKGSCYYPWIYPQVTATGELLPCCLIPQFGEYSRIVKKYSFGNVFRHNFGEIWNSKRAVKFRTSLVLSPNEYCRRCSKYFGIM